MKYFRKEVENIGQNEIDICHRKLFFMEYKFINENNGNGPINKLTKI